MNIQEMREAITDYDELTSRLPYLEEMLKELKTAGGCGNMTLFRHSDSTSSNLRPIVPLDWRGEDSHIVEYFVNKIESEIKTIKSEIATKFGS